MIIKKQIKMKNEKKFIEGIKIPSKEEIKKVSLWWYNKCYLQCTCNSSSCKYCKTLLVMEEEIFK